jgi:hypothetical protein
VKKEKAASPGGFLHAWNLPTAKGSPHPANLLSFRNLCPSLSLLPSSATAKRQPQPWTVDDELLDCTLRPSHRDTRSVPAPHRPPLPTIDVTFAPQQNQRLLVSMPPFSTSFFSRPRAARRRYFRGPAEAQQHRQAEAHEHQPARLPNARPQPRVQHSRPRARRFGIKYPSASCPRVLHSRLLCGTPAPKASALPSAACHIPSSSSARNPRRIKHRSKKPGGVGGTHRKRNVRTQIRHNEGHPAPQLPGFRWLQFGRQGASCQQELSWY